jgi:RND family efflux transporter MFP subunit
MTTFKPHPAAALSLALLSLTGVTLAIAPAHALAADDKKPAPAKAALTVTSARPSASMLPITLAANGNVAAWQEALIGSEAGGLRLTDVRVNVGDVVKKGQVLAVFAADSIEADLAQARANLQETEANAAEAVSNAARARSVQDSGALSAQQISQYMTAEQSANARIAAAKASLATQQLRLRHTQVTAPDSGIISARSATVGAVVGVGSELFRMIRQGRLEWRAEVTAAELSRLKPGDGAQVKAANGSVLTGRVRMIAPTIDPHTRSALVYVDLPPGVGANPPFKAGMFASGQFDLGSSSALTVPQQAVVVRDGFSYVFRLNRDLRVSQVKVQTGRRLNDRVELLGVLAPETQIVVSGAGFLNDGDLVHQVPVPAPAAVVAK